MVEIQLGSMDMIQSIAAKEMRECVKHQSWPADSFEIVRMSSRDLA